MKKTGVVPKFVGAGLMPALIELDWVGTRPAPTNFIYELSNFIQETLS
jgi:hypothetical protein